jgi:hypothetical protein
MWWDIGDGKKNIAIWAGNLIIQGVPQKNAQPYFCPRFIVYVIGNKPITS